MKYSLEIDLKSTTYLEDVTDFNPRSTDDFASVLRRVFHTTYTQIQNHPQILLLRNELISDSAGNLHYLEI